MEWVGVGRRKKSDERYRKFKDSTGPSISNWPEANAIRKKTQNGERIRHRQLHLYSFHELMFGMPLAFPFLSDGKKPPETELLPMKKDKTL